jgi:eukaryotic-like serine/threonine-protein kinase
LALTGRLLLAPDVVLVPLAELGEDERRQLGGDPESWVLSHPRRRTLARLVDADAAALLAEFRAARTVAEAVIAFGQSRGSDPAGVLEAAYPLLERLHEAGFLVEEAAAAAGSLRPALEVGAQVAGRPVRACVRVLEDSEVYRLGEADPPSKVPDAAALKIERPAGEDGPERRGPCPLAWEEAVLRYLESTAPAAGGARVAPALLAAGLRDGRRYLVLEWCPGVDAVTAARTARVVEGRPGLLALGRAVLAAYAALHGRQVVHGDVHPHNLLVAADGRVRLVDFGAAVLPPGAADGLPYPGRSGVGFFFEPEYAAALLSGAPAPPPSPAGEQYAVASLLYLLFAGAHSCDFRLAREDMLRQIAAAPPLPFAARGLPPWPAVEEVLARALAKDPAARFPSLADFARALAAVPEPAASGRARSTAAGNAEPVRPGRPDQLPGAARALLDAVLERTVPAAGADGSSRPALAANVHSGAAGVACGLYRIALAREDPGLLAAADLWAERAARTASGIGFAAEDAGSAYHGPPGIFAVQALVAHARSDEAALRAALAAFATAARAPAISAASAASAAGLDLTLGRAGLLLAAAQLAALLPAAPPAALTALGNELLAGLWAELDALPAAGACGGRPNLGLAHGWAGLLYASLRWCRVAGMGGSARPAGLAARLAELAELAEPLGRGLSWPWLAPGEGGGSGAPGAGSAAGDAGAMPGWCNGSAGLVHLWELAHRELGDPAYGRLAEQAAWNAWEDLAGGGDLCCGRAGRAYALLLLARAGAGREWLGRARELAGRAAAEIRAAGAPFGLYRGEVGVAALAADLARPDLAAQPFFGDEAW